MESANSVLCRHIGAAWQVEFYGIAGPHQFDAHAVRVAKTQDGIAVTIVGMLDWNSGGKQAPFPKLRRGTRYCGRLAYAGTASRSTGSCKERQDRARRSNVIVKVEVVYPRIVKINSELDEPESQHLRVEIQNPLRI